MLNPDRLTVKSSDALNDALRGLDADDRRLLERALPALEGLATQLKDRHR